ncbi:MAG: hypothetical protein AB8B78_02690 [Polaribacter sp.]
MKIFRKIRFDLLKNNNSSGKYLKYAIGEIVLVVIGILIALQINLWNEDRKNTDILTANLEGVLKELKIDANKVNDLIINYKENNKNRKNFINVPNYEKLSLGVLEGSLENFTKDLDLQYSYFKKIQNSGITQFGDYEKIMEGLIEYYDNTLPYLNKLTAIYDDQVTKEDEFWRYEQNSYEFNFLDGLKSYQTDQEAKRKLIELLKTPTARNILKIDMRRNIFIISRLSKLKPKLKNMILSLEEILSKN